ncbi:uncharacterized protein METZ01_LOCUS82113 [marine metagenome]|uniref:Uncharacterized protein n=1 Tax=marine metagenome TaxID=408172 RepID=A0A381UMA0_9ZZZZ
MSGAKKVKSPAFLKQVDLKHYHKLHSGGDLRG